MAPRPRSGTVDRDDFPFRLRRNGLVETNRPLSGVEGGSFSTVYRTTVYLPFLLSKKTDRSSKKVSQYVKVVLRL